ncbi:DnaD domain protein [Bacillus altitudinis]|uniref:DnaD domain-containing protein n=1 Tax=Bacillus altitudinis TaxID=293387 RepID=UPI002280FD75|nr:DnaD domain protein [Bacillus altitudinis]MCY7631435.1 DnaD domain protein [Bacillus altitudinis]
MNYLKEINGFMRWLETSPLNPTTQALWFHLMDINNNCAWKDWFTVSNSRLYSRLGVVEKTMIDHRKLLIKHGRIEYKPKGKAAGSYRIISLENTASIAPVPDEEPEKPKEEKPTRQEDKQSMNAFEFYESHFGGTLNSFVSQRIGDLIDDFGEENVIKAMEVTLKNGVQNIKYVQRVLSNQRAQEGVKKDAEYGRYLKVVGESKSTPSAEVERLEALAREKGLSGKIRDTHCDF